MLSFRDLASSSVLVLLISLQSWTKYAGLAWLVIGILYGAYKTRGFTLRPKLIDFSES